MSAEPPEVHFYHLTRTPLEKAAPLLLEKCLERGWRVTVRLGAPERVAALDRHLWLYRDEAFLPHGAPGAPSPEMHPIWLTSGPDLPNRPDALMLADGAEAGAEELAAMKRTMLLFDGHDEAALAAARAFWKSVTVAGLKAIYWAEGDHSGWTRKAESGA